MACPETPSETSSWVTRPHLPPARPRPLLDHRARPTPSPFFLATADVSARRARRARRKRPRCCILKERLALVSRSLPCPLETAGKTSHPDLAHFPGPKGRADKGATGEDLKPLSRASGSPPTPGLSPLGGSSLEALRPRLLCALTRSLLVRCFAPSRYAGPVPLRPLRPLLSAEPV